MDQHPDSYQNSSVSSTEPTADSRLVAVCDDCCIDGSLLSTDTDVTSGFLLRRNGADSDDHDAQEMDDKCDDDCHVVDVPRDQSSLDHVHPDSDVNVPRDQSSLDHVHPDSDAVDDAITSVRVCSSSNDCADVSAAEQVTEEDEDKCSDKVAVHDSVNRAAVDEPVISAVDIYGGLNLAGSWNPVIAQRRREVVVGRAAVAQFTCQASGSLSLVRRLELYSKLDGHTGCVNALHFNESGNSVNFATSTLCLPFAKRSHFIFTTILAKRSF